MTNANHQLIREFFVAIAQGDLPDNLVTGDMAAWTLTSGDTDKVRFASGVRLLATIFSGTLVYTMDSITAEDDRVVAECQSRGKLVDGQDFHNHHVFLFEIRDGRISSVREYMNPTVVMEKIVPLMKQFMAKAAT
jgi:uncharacterized protein